MLAFERYRKIKEILQEYNYIDVVSLSALLNVSQVTIRKDLETLEASGVLTRVHGGAVISRGDFSAASENETSGYKDIYAEEKEKIGQIAARLVCSNDVIFLGHGSTCYYIAKHLDHLENVTVITNNVSVAEELYNKTNISVLCVGGNAAKYNDRLYFYGSFAIETINKLHLNKAFLSPTGVDLKYGYSVSTPEVLDICNALKGATDEIIIVADYTKFDKTSMLKLASMTEIKTVVTNENVPSEYKDFYFRSSIGLYTTIDSKVD